MVSTFLSNDVTVIICESLNRKSMIKIPYNFETKASIFLHENP